jgi:hypothetical protein
MHENKLEIVIDFLIVRDSTWKGERYAFITYRVNHNFVSLNCQSGSSGEKEKHEENLSENNRKEKKNFGMNLRGSWKE